MHMIFFLSILFVSNNKNHSNDRQEKKGVRGNLNNATKKFERCT